MSMYNMVNGFNPACVFVAPLIVGGHPQELVARFRDCFLMEGGKAVIFARLGGGNREGYVNQIAWLRSLPGYLSDEDWDEDSTYALFTYSIPDRFKPDVELLKEGKHSLTSEEYKKTIIGTYPKLESNLKKAFFETTPENAQSL